MINIPEKRLLNAFDEEPFEAYLERWPDELSHFPCDIVEQWVYRHNEQFRQQWGRYTLGGWRFVEALFDNQKIMAVGHFFDEMRHIDDNGQKFLHGKMRGNFVAEYMLENGTTPSPMVIALNAGDFPHPKAHQGERMTEPYHLLEGHRRLAFLRAMILADHSNLMKAHKVWLVELGGFPV